MPRKYVSKTGRKNRSHKVQVVPDKFRAGFLAELDSRTGLAKALRANYEQIVADVGGTNDVGHVKAALVQRFVWLEAILQTLEHEMARGKIDKGEALGRWIQAVNALSGLAKTLGIERKTRSMPWLTSLPAETPNGNGVGKPHPPRTSNGDEAGTEEKP